MDGDKEGMPRIFRQTAERRTVTVTANIVPGEWADENVEAAGETLDHFLRSLGNPATVLTVNCDVVDDAPEQLRVRAVAMGEETDLHALASHVAEEVGGMPGLKDEVGAVAWQLSTPDSMRSAWASDGTMSA